MNPLDEAQERQARTIPDRLQWLAEEIEARIPVTKGQYLSPRKADEARSKARALLTRYVPGVSEEDARLVVEYVYGEDGTQIGFGFYTYPEGYPTPQVMPGEWVPELGVQQDLILPDIKLLIGG